MPQTLLFIIIFLTGLAVGSFLNCVIFRLEVGESFFFGRSYCPHCKHKLGSLDLIPVFSFLWLRGRCRYCQEKISWQYPLVELTTGILFVLVILEITTIVSISSIYYFIIISFLVVIFVYDLKHYIIPDKVVYPAIALALIFNFKFLIFNQFLIFNYLILSAFGAAAFFAAIVVFSRGRWMGVGDIKLAFLMGLFLGWPNILAALFLAFFTGAIIGIVLIALGTKKMKSEVPFGPFLVTGTLAALFWGESIIQWYLQLFG